MIILTKKAVRPAENKASGRPDAFPEHQANDDITINISRITKLFNTYDRVNLTMPKGKKEKIKAAADAAGMSVNEYINASIDVIVYMQGRA